MSKRAIVSVTLLFLASVLILSASAWASCTAPANAIEAENCITTGSTPQSVWDVGTPPNSGTGDSSIQGFGDNISVNVGDTINFKVNTNATAFHLDIYRMGYYQGNGARLITTIQGTPQSQPACLTNSSLGLYDCGNWKVSASWTVPTTAVSGIYFARAVRNDTGGASHIMFIVRNDASHSDILFQATDTSWQAYNDFGGQNFYGCGGWDLTCRSFKNSYNRPFHTRDFEGESVTFVFGNEYPMIRWLEANGYDVTYFTDTDTDRNGSLILNHKLWMSNGHDEYWSGNQRANIEAARNAGVHLAFFSGNTMFWKVRWENSTDGSNTPYRTLVCYKETAGDVTDPLDKSPTWTWTGTWRDPTNSPPADAGKPENAVKGNIFRMNGGQSATMQVPSADGKMRFWRNTTVATASGTTNLATGTVGAEFDDDEDNGFRPAGLFELTATSVTDSGNYLLDYGVTYGSGTAINKLVMYRHTSGAIVFSTGTYRWSWGLDNHHDDTSEGSNTNLPMQQATVNLFADMGIQPVTLQSGLLLATQSTDHTPPNSTITSPAQGATIGSGTKVTIQGTAADTGGGVVAGVEVSTDGGTTWHPASGRTPWTYTWNASGNSTVNIKSRAVDDSGNLETPSAGVTVTVGSGSQSCPCTIFGAATPSTSDEGADSPSEIGVRFKSDVAGQITGIRFYKSAANTGTHIGNLWNSSGTNLATGTFTNETASGWQTLTFASPVSITAGTYYVASYFNTIGHYAEDDNFFTAAYDNAPLHAAQDGVPAADGVYIYSSSSAFPNQTWESANYYVDVVFTTTAATVDVSSVTVNPTSVSGGSSSSGTVTLNAPAGSSGMVVSLSSDNAAASPSVGSVTIASGQTTGTFLVNTQAVSSVAMAHISAKDSNNVTVQATLTVTPPPALSSVTINPTTVVGGNGSTGTVTLSEPATVPGIQVNLSSDSASAQVGSNVIVPTGATTATFPITTSQVSTATAAHISGTYNSVTPPAATLTINPLTVNSVSLNPTAVIGGNSSTGTVTLSGPTPSAISVTLGSTAGATVPASVTINANASSATFTATTTGVSSATTSTITATYGTSSAQATLNINPLTVVSVSLNPSTVVGPTGSTGTVTLSGPAPTATSVSLGSTTGATVPASVTVNANATTATFAVTTVAVSTSITSTITATLGTSSAQAGLTVNPPALASVSMNPTSVVGGNSSTGTVTLTGPAPSTGLTVNLSATTGATVPSTVNVAGNATTATFTATTSAVSSNVTSTITASYNGVNQTATLTVTTAAALAIDQTVTKDSNSGSKTIVTAAFTTKAANELLLAFVAADGPSSGTNTTASVTGGGLAWTLVKRTNTQRGTAEVWRAFATTVLTNATVTATLSTSQSGSMTVVTFTGASTAGTGGSGAIGATGTGNSAKGAPTASLVTTVANSWVFGVANDWDKATARTVPSNQTMVHQDVATGPGDTYWVQRMTAVTPTPGTTVTINDTAPTGDKFNMTIVEVLP